MFIVYLPCFRCYLTSFIFYLTCFISYLPLIISPKISCKMFIASQTTPLKCSQLTYHTSYLSKPPLQKVHSFPNHPLKKFIAYLPYFIAYLTSTSQLSKPSPLKVHRLFNILHSLLTILHILLNTLHILWFSQLTYHTSYLSNLNRWSGGSPGGNSALL